MFSKVCYLVKYKIHASWIVCSEFLLLLSYQIISFKHLRYKFVSALIFVLYFILNLMKKVRFETPTTFVMDYMTLMQEYECHSPRPFLERRTVNLSYNDNDGTPVVFSNDPVHRFENDNCLPHPTAKKTSLDVFRELENKKVPSSDLDLSMLDNSKPLGKIPSPQSITISKSDPNAMALNSAVSPSHKMLTSIENMSAGNKQSFRKGNEFFLRRDKLCKESIVTQKQQLEQYNISNKNDPLRKESDLMTLHTPILSEKENNAPTQVEFNTKCNCHHCLKIISHTHNIMQNNNVDLLHRHIPRINCNVHNFVPTPAQCSCNCNMQIVQPSCNYNNSQPSLILHHAIDKKTWAIKKFEKSQENESTEIEKPNILLKEKREPTVSDLFKIIKLQNEQLQLLQEKVDKFISTHSNEEQRKQKVPIQNYLTEQLEVQTLTSEQQKISIGVMTSFEMVRTSTMINKEIVKQCEAQIQCNRSQISIKEVVSKKQTGNVNFLEGISPFTKHMDQLKPANAQICLKFNDNESCHADNIIEDKTLNELSLYNVQVDNATTPLMSPEQSLYLDIRDYSESDSGSDDQSNVGWTYYNKVMTHVNGMLQDSDMPSSASALYRHTKQRCIQIDKSNVSVGKRVTFGDDPLVVQERHTTPSTDTSLRMNQLAAKYLKHAPDSHTPSPKATDEMSFATRKYMERHKLLQGSTTPIQQDIPRFLDITALKQQPKFV